MNCPCPRCHKHPARIDQQYGVLPCTACQTKDTPLSKKIRKQPEFYSLNRKERIEGQRDEFGGDLEQPWGKDWKPNAAFIKAQPKMAQEYFSKEELAESGV